MGGGGAQRLVWRVNESKKTGARSARARTRGQNPLVYNIMLFYSYVNIIIYHVQRYKQTHILPSLAIFLTCVAGILIYNYNILFQIYSILFVLLYMNFRFSVNKRQFIDLY
jgi:hypothetical protein